MTLFYLLCTILQIYYLRKFVVLVVNIQYSENDQDYHFSNSANTNGAPSNGVPNI